MAEYTAVAAQTVAAGQNIAFTETAVAGNRCITHREGSGIVTLRGITNQCRARYRLIFGGNVAIPTGGAVGTITLALAISGEAVQSTEMDSTPAATDQYGNVSAAIFIDVPAGCCVNVAVENTSTQAISVKNANLIAERVA